MARLDSELVARGIARSRERAKEMIRSGNVTVNGLAAKKPSDEVSSSDDIESSEQEIYVGRGALKLEKAVREFCIDLAGKVCLDIGASTGGFTDLMLRNGASKVFAVDVGHDQLAEVLQNDNRVVNMEKTDVRNVTSEMLGGCVDFVCADVSFISLKMILPKIHELLNENAAATVLIKPQFEAGKKDVGKGGIVKDKKVHIRVLSDIDSFAAGMGLLPEKYTVSPVKGGSGNIEYLVLLRKARGEYFIRDFKELVESSFDKI